MITPMIISMITPIITPMITPIFTYMITADTVSCSHSPQPVDERGSAPAVLQEYFRIDLENISENFEKIFYTLDFR